MLVLAWAAVVAIGLRTLFAYETTPGQVGRIPETWPGGAKVKLAEKTDTLLMFVHPRCPCTAASVEELAQIMAQLPGRLRSYVLLWSPPNSGAAWSSAEIAQSAAQIPGVVVLPDPGGAQASAFGAKTSGYVLLFDPQGRRLFRGGITGMRGHVGDNLGSNAVVSLVRGESRAPKSSQVFGCSLLADSR